MAKEREIKRHGVTVAKVFPPTKGDLAELERRRKNKEQLEYISDKLDSISDKLDTLLEHFEREE